MKRRGFVGCKAEEKEKIMLNWALTFLVLALIAGFFGFGGVAAVSANFAQILFVIFIVLFVVSALLNVLKGKRPPMN